MEVSSNSSSTLTDNIPVELRTLKQWVLWRYETREEKLTKVPYQANGRKAESDNPATWTSFDKTLAALPKFDGLGVMFANGLAGIDLDHHIEGGKVSDFARSVVERVNSYTELSPSGTGLHILFFGCLPEGRRRKDELGIEMYSSGRFFTITGKRLDGAPAHVSERSPELAALHTEVFGKAKPMAQPKPAQPNNLDDQALIEKAAAAQNGGKFSSLYSGNWKAYFTSQSEADLALCSILAFWTGGDAGRTDRLFRSSGLMREKWDERHNGNGATYGQLTLDRGLAQSNYYTPRTRIEREAPEPYYPPMDDIIDQLQPPCEDIITPPAGLHRNSSNSDYLPFEQVRACFERQEAGDAEIFTALYTGCVAYDHSSGKWHLWKTHYWQPDQTGSIHSLVTNGTAAQYLHAAAEAQAAGKDDLSKDLIKRAGSLQTRKRADNVLFFAARSPEIALTGEEWDRNPWVLGCENGVIDLRTGELRPGRPDDYIRSHVPYDWKGIDTTCPTWEAFQESVTGKDQQIVNFKARLFGYGITGLTIEHVLPIPWGEGRNGKSTELETLGEVLGKDLATSSQADTLMDTNNKAGEGPKPFVYALRGKRIVWASESNEGRRINSGLVKQLTGGDTLTVRTLHSNPVSFAPSHLVLLITNNKPHMSAEDTALWDRVILIPYTQRFVDDPKAPNEGKADKNLREKLAAEREGILAWLVRGCLEWQRQGLNVPAKLKAATEAYRNEEDTLGLFESERCIKGPSLTTRGGLLYADYQEWAKINGIEPLSLPAFGIRMKKRYEHKESHGIWYLGIGLTEKERG
jgi:putative DNA primase/helicase